MYMKHQNLVDGGIVAEMSRETCAIMRPIPALSHFPSEARAGQKSVRVLTFPRSDDGKKALGAVEAARLSTETFRRRLVRIIIQLRVKLVDRVLRLGLWVT